MNAYAAKESSEWLFSNAKGGFTLYCSNTYRFKIEFEFEIELDDPNDAAHLYTFLRTRGYVVEVFGGLKQRVF